MSTLSDAALANPIESSADATRAAMSESIISPRFYTTDFAAMNRINVAPVRAEFDQMMAEFEGDNNQDHWSASSPKKRTPTSSQNTFTTRCISQKKSAMRATSAFTGSSRNIQKNAFTLSFVGSSAGVTTSFGTAKRSRSSCAPSRICCAAQTRGGFVFF